ncbi:PhzF family phenazine biosynthesis protein [Clostridium sp. AM58-1XD]|uniref:PhzF family phenazine biosynthesis protein n=1 Tax=Clostridium sp. AM58-1XD TaxID=2292307 RepID=UPI000E4C29C6|nr:PhzF family phenazine biosynthesis protein [Clostridium sp. AM58-1XD]RGY97015.1 PhzF family phenazine biosynthesis protein [Clostridium sp. AM58-1XD]
MNMYFVDAFADQLFTGNPAAVCYASEWTADEIMQKIAAENNLPETAFLVKEGETYAIRWFTPRYEIDLCGHATLASAFVIHNFIDKGISSAVFTSQSGNLYVECRDGLYTLNFPSRPAPAIGRLEAAEQALGIPVQEFYLSRDLIAVVENEDMIKEMEPDFSRLEALAQGDGVIVTAPGNDFDFVSRCFYPKCGVNEDPVTGSAHCNLIPYWSRRLGREKMIARQLSERGGTLYCQDLGGRVLISGRAVLFYAAQIKGIL